MALLSIHPDGTYESRCAICEKPLTEPVFATSHFISDQSDRLWRFSDAGMHWDCYANWKYLRRFANQYFEALLQGIPNNPYWAVVTQTETFLISANPNLADPVADIDLRAIGPGFRVPIGEWTDWVNGGWDDFCVHDIQRLAMFDIESQVRQIVPDSETLMTLAREKLKTEA